MEANLAKLTILFTQFTTTTSEEIKQLHAQVDALRDENAKLKARVEQLEKCTVVSSTSEKVVEKFRTVERAIEEFVMTAPLELFEEEDKGKIDRMGELQWMITRLRTKPKQYWKFLSNNYCKGKFIINDTILDGTFHREYIDDKYRELGRADDEYRGRWHIPEWDKIAVKYGLQDCVWRS